MYAAPAVRETPGAREAERLRVERNDSELVEVSAAVVLAATELGGNEKASDVDVNGLPSARSLLRGGSRFPYGPSLLAAEAHAPSRRPNYTVHERRAPDWHLINYFEMSMLEDRRPREDSNDEGKRTTKAHMGIVAGHVVVGGKEHEAEQTS